MAIKYQYLAASVEITTANQDIEITDSGTNTVQIATGTYFVGDGTSADLLTAIQTALDTSPSANTYLVTLSGAPDIDADNVAAAVTVSRDTGSDTFDVLWDSANPTSTPQWVGFDAGKGGATAGDQVSTVSPSLLYVPNDVADFAEPVDRGAGTQVRTVNGQVYTFDRSQNVYSDYVLSLTWLKEKRVWTRANAADTEATLQNFWSIIRDGRRMRLYEGTITSGTLVQAPSAASLLGMFHLDGGQMNEFAPDRFSAGSALYDYEFELLGYVAA